MKNKHKLLYGAYSTVLVIVVIIAAIALNVFIERLEAKNALKLDLTQNQVYSLDKLTISQIKDLDQEIYIYFFVEESIEGDRDISLLDELLNRYAAVGKSIHVEHLDPAKEPALVSRFSRSDTAFPSPIAIVVADGNARKSDKVKFRPPISADSLVDADTGYIIAERILTGSIMSFGESNSANVLFLSGHGDVLPENNPGMQNYLEAIGYNVGTIRLPAQEDTLNPEDVLVTGGLTSDLNEDEARAIEAHLDAGGRMMLMFELTNEKFPVFDALLSKYKISSEKGVVMERSTDYILREGYNNIILTDRSAHPIMDSLSKNSDVIMESSCPVKVEDANTSTGEVTFGSYSGNVSTLVTSSITSYFKGIDSSTTAFTAEDKTGPFVLGLAYELNNGENKAKITVFGSTSVYYSTSSTAPGNFGTFVNSINWLSDRDAINIPGKDITPESFEIKNQTQVLILSAVVIIIVPLLILGMGLIVWLKRKNR